MSTRAIRAEIALQNLDPTKPYRHCSRDGRLTGDPVSSEILAPQTARQAEPEKPVIKNALVQLDEVAETASAVAEAVVVPEEHDADVASEEETPKKAFGKKKKGVSTDL